MSEKTWQYTPGVSVIDFSKVPSEQQQSLLVELILHDSWSRRLRQDAAIPVIVVLDECQKFSFGPNNATTQLLRQGRKYKMSGWFASQWITNKEAINALDQAALRAYFRPESSNLHALARRLSSVDKSGYLPARSG